MSKPVVCWLSRKNQRWFVGKTIKTIGEDEGGVGQVLCWTETRDQRGGEWSKTKNTNPKNSPSQNLLSVGHWEATHLAKHSGNN